MAGGKRQKFFEAFGPENEMKSSVWPQKDRRGPNEIFQRRHDFVTRRGPFGLWRATALALSIERRIGEDVIEPPLPGRAAEAANVRLFEANDAEKVLGVLTRIFSRCRDQVGLDFESDDLNRCPRRQSQRQRPNARAQFRHGLAGLEFDGVSKQADFVTGPTAASVQRDFDLQDWRAHSVSLRMQDLVHVQGSICEIEADRLATTGV